MATQNDNFKTYYSSTFTEYGIDWRLKVNIPYVENHHNYMYDDPSDGERDDGNINYVGVFLFANSKGIERTQ